MYLQDLATNAWTGSVLVLSFGPQPPLLTLSHTGHQFNPQPTCLDTFQNFNFWRWQLDLQLMPQESVVDYRLASRIPCRPRSASSTLLPLPPILLLDQR